jgi:lipopolysaccharide/colanic/teichoic acid biosynthesis glycosyltransferase
MILAAAILGIFGAALSRLIADDIRAWVPRLVEIVIARAIKNLPADIRERYHEEWLSNVSEVPGDLSKLIYSLGVLPASWQMRGIARRATQGASASSDGITGAFDVFFAAILLILASPIFLFVNLANLFSDGPLFFAHPRIGHKGRMFPCLKFRTMVVDGDRILNQALACNPALAAEWAETGKLKNDPRVTSIGRFLRATSLEELPQLINVIRRQMSLVGPRPIVQSEVKFYGEEIEHYYSTRPGITGLWQIAGKSNDSYINRVRLDVWYAKNRSFWLYLSVLIRLFSKR